MHHHRFALPLVALGFLVASAAKPTQAGGVDVAPFGKTADGQSVEEFTLTGSQGTGSQGVVAKIITRGATLRSLVAPDREGKAADVVLGFDSVEGYESEANQYFGCTVGRVCNRIDNGEFSLGGKTYKLFTNDGDNHLHGGNGRSLDKVVWEGRKVESDRGPAAEFHYTSPDGEEGYPGNLDITVRYTLTDDGGLEIEYTAKTDQDTPVNLTNHAYFNLAGAGAPTVLDHVLMVRADRYTPVDDELIPTGEITSVEGTPLDFRRATRIGARLAAVADTATMGYDHNLILDKAEEGQMSLAARLVDPGSGRMLEVHTTEPALQFYSGNFLHGQTGKDGKTYPHRSAVCLEAQHYPDSVNHDNFPSIILKPGETYRQTTIYKLGVVEE